MAKVSRPWGLLGWSVLGGVVGIVPLPASAAAPRQVLPETVVPVHYAVSIAPDAAALSFQGEVVADVEVRAPTRTITLNAVDLVLEGARLDNGEALDMALDKATETATFTAAAPIPPGRHRLGIRWHGPITRFTSGFFALDYQTPQGQPRRLLATKFEPAAARRFMPLWDEPAAKASYTLTATVPVADMAVSNTPIDREETLGDGRKRVTFAATPRMSSYLLFFATGDLERISRRVGNVDVGVVARRGAAERGRFALDAAAQLLPFYNRYFGVDYPLPKLDLVAGPGAGSFGAMENWGAVFFFEPVLLLDPATSGAAERQRVYGVVAHEMAHQWFGDLVTMAWWDDLWLNEGFASWMAARATAEFHPEWQPWLDAQVERGDAMRLDALAGTHPVIQDVASGPAANQAFDGITYGKGQAVIRMLEATVGDGSFRRGVADYMRAHQYGNTANADLWQALGRVSPQPVEVIARDFLTQPGVPLVRVGADGRLAQGRLSYENDAPPAAWHIPLRVARLAADGTAGPPSTLLLAPDAGAGIETGAQTGAGAPRVELPALVNAGQSAYARVAYDAAGFQALVPAFPRLPPADQIGLLDDAWAIGQADAGAAPRTLALLDTLPPDADPLVWSQALVVLSAIGRLEQDQPGEARWQAWERGLLAAPFARLGWDARPHEAANDAILRQDLLLALGRADDPTVLAEARRRFAAWTADPARLDPALVQTVLALAGRQATPQDFADLRARARAERDPERQVLLYRAMAQVRDPALARRMLDLATGGEAPPARAADLVRTVARSHPDLAWRHALATLPALAPNLDLRQRYQYLPGVAAAASDAARADELRAIAQRDFPPDARRFAVQAEAGIRQRARVRQQVLPALDGWLARAVTS